MMRIPNWLAGIAHIVLLVTIPVVLLVSPLYLFATNGFVRHEYAQKGFPPSTRFNTPERLRLSETVLRFIRGYESLEALASMHTDSGEVAMRPEEVQHLADVKVVMDGFFLVHRASVVLVLCGALLIWYSARQELLGFALRQGIWISCGLIGFVVIASFINFDLFFTRFHQLFFTAESWLFYEEDTLIQLYPLPLWIDAVWKIGVLVFMEMGVFYLLSVVARRGALNKGLT